jgi:hypothetical protein
VTTLDEFVAFARKNGKVNFGTYSAGSAPHMTINELNKQYGLNIEPVHYRGEAPMWTGLMEGTLDVAMGSYTAAQPVLQSNRGVAFACIRKRSMHLRTSRPCPSKVRHRSSSPSAASPAGHCRRPRRSRSLIGWRNSASQPITIRVKEVLATFVLEPALGFKETNALYQRELPVWMDSAKSLGLEPV